MSAPAYVVGVDLGKHTDPAAASVVETRGRDLLVRALKRWPLLTPYPVILDDLGARLASPALAGADVTLCIDGTGVGSVFQDMVRRARLPVRFLSVVITSGRRAERDARDPSLWRVPKRMLVEVLLSAVVDGRLTVAASLPGAETFAGELRDFERRTTETGYQKFGARAGRHDDVLLSLSIALWVAALDAHTRGRAA